MKDKKAEKPIRLPSLKTLLRCVTKDFACGRGKAMLSREIRKGSTARSLLLETLKAREKVQIYRMTKRERNLDSFLYWIVCSVTSSWSGTGYQRNARAIVEYVRIYSQ